MSVIGRNEADGALLIKMERRARCACCGIWIKPEGLAWSYLANPTDGNYVEHDSCRYPDDSNGGTLQ